MSLNKLSLQDLSKPALLLAAFALTGTSLLAGIYALTAPRITANEHLALLQQINTLVAPERYDNDPIADSVSLPAAALGSSKPVVVYRARKQNQPVAALFITTTPNGYSGDIRMVVGVNADQTLAGVRILAHKETPGLGDKIETGRGSWIFSFTNKSLTKPSEEKWAVKKDGGEFDQFTGATITPRAVVGAVKRVLQWQHANRLYEMPAQEIR